MGLIQYSVVPHPQAARTRMRVLLMPGAYHTTEQFMHAGFDLAVRERALPVELILATPDLAHLTDRRWLMALHDEVVAPARAHGSIPLWLGGVSLGGFMALRFAAQYPAQVDGLCLLAPYLGSRIIAREFATDIAAPADPTGWHTGPLDDDDDERRMWQYVVRLGTSLTPTRVFLGLGADDRFADTQQVLQRALPARRTTTRVIAGGHDWPVWRQLWNHFLDDCATFA